MNFKKLLQYGLMTTCLFGNALAMNEAYDVSKNAIPRRQSLIDIKAASELALAESRELHIFLGANPSEHHVVQLQVAEEKREAEEGIKAPIKLFFVNPLEAQTPSAKTPILHADFNKEESWNTILEALTLTRRNFNGVFDKIYFDASTAKFTEWDEGILAKIAILLKKSGELYIPDAKLASQSSFCDSEIESNYQLILETQKDPAQQEKTNRPYKCSLNPKNISTAPFLRGGCTSNYGMRDGKMYITNSLTLVYDTTFQPSGIIGHPLTFETFDGDKMYPNIGMDYRLEPKKIIDQHIRINSFIKVTLDDAEKSEAEAIIFGTPTVSETKENMINEELPIEAAPTRTSTKEEYSEVKLPNLNVAKENLSLENVTTAAKTKVILREEKETATKQYYNPSEIGYKEIKFPSLAKIKEDLLLGRSTIFSETHDAFHVQSIMGPFNGFRSEAQEKGFELSMRVSISPSSYKEKDSYKLIGYLNVIFEGNKKILLLLKHPNSYPFFRLQEGIEHRRGNSKTYSNLEKIMVPID